MEGSIVHLDQSELDDPDIQRAAIALVEIHGSGPPSPLRLPLHPNFLLLAQRRRRLLRQARAAPPQARRLPVRAAINRFIAETNHDPKPFIWMADPDKIIAAAERGRQLLDSIHSHVRLCKMLASGSARHGRGRGRGDDG
jgi:hypothetical protein